MLRILKIVLVTLLLIIIISIPLVIYLVRLNNRSYLGELIKQKILPYPKLVKLLNLNEPGDARYLYLNPQNYEIKVNIFSVNDAKTSNNLKVWIGDIINETVGKKAMVSETETIIYEKEDLLTNGDLNAIRNRINSENYNEADLNLVYASSYADKPSSVGLVLHRDTIFIFTDAIEKLSEKGYVKDILEKLRLCTSGDIF